ncbi:MAG TPA: VTT domain-containing protein [Candidatus Acidoferrales bacterium]|nr:VTT domain-containing protein [Candidatus Acidoferrales bacterium]
MRHLCYNAPLDYGKDRAAVKAPKLPGWLTHIVGTIGGAGLFVVAFLDSSVLSFPFITDLLFIDFVLQHHARMLYYAGMAAAGSLSGCIWLYLLAKKGGAAYRKRHGHKAPGRIQGLVHRHAFLSVFLPSILPPPFPFKAFVIAEGMAQVPVRTFLLGVLIGRGLRYAVEGLFALKYGLAIEDIMMRNKTIMIIAPLVLIGVIYLFTRWLLKPATRAHSS